MSEDEVFTECPVCGADFTEPNSWQAKHGPDWSPIETAPTDETRVLGLHQPSGKISITSSRGEIVSRWVFGTSAYTRVMIWKDESEPEDYGYPGEGGIVGHGDWSPTHWMHLPKPI